MGHDLDNLASRQVFDNDSSRAISVVRRVVDRVKVVCGGFRLGAEELS